MDRVEFNYWQVRPCDTAGQAPHFHVESLDGGTVIDTPDVRVANAIVEARNAQGMLFRLHAAAFPPGGHPGLFVEVPHPSGVDDEWGLQCMICDAEGFGWQYGDPVHIEYVSHEPGCWVAELVDFFANLPPIANPDPPKREPPFSLGLRLNGGLN